jgi:hypothetical protein
MSQSYLLTYNLASLSGPIKEAITQKTNLNFGCFHKTNEHESQAFLSFLHFPQIFEYHFVFMWVLSVDDVGWKLSRDLHFRVDCYCARWRFTGDSLLLDISHTQGNGKVLADLGEKKAGKTQYCPCLSPLAGFMHDVLWQNCMDIATCPQKGIFSADSRESLIGGFYNVLL